MLVRTSTAAWRPTSICSQRSRQLAYVGISAATTGSSVGVRLLKPWSEPALWQLVAQARKPQSCGLMKRVSFGDCAPHQSGLRKGVQLLASGARYRDRIRRRGSEVDSNHLLDLILEQRGLCAYSGVPMELLKPHSHWRMSIERIDNTAGYVRGNYCLIAAEFNSAVRTESQDSAGSAQWSRQKVKELTHVRSHPLQLHHLQEDIAAARQRPRAHGKQQIHVFRGPNSTGHWWCTGCGLWKLSESFELDQRRKEVQRPRSRCRECRKKTAASYLQTPRGHGLKLLAAARQRAGTRIWRGDFALDLQDVLDMLWQQGGRCYYSGVPLHCASGPADWVWSIERLHNDVSYSRQNCVLIAQEFNTSDHSRNINARSQVNGTAQWSRDKASLVWGKFWPDSRYEEHT